MSRPDLDTDEGRAAYRRELMARFDEENNIILHVHPSIMSRRTHRPPGAPR